MPRIYTNARAQLVEAASRVVVRDGLEGLTAEAVVREAKVSRGGLFHHFSTMDQLAGAVLSQLAEEADRWVRREAQGRPRRAGSPTARARVALALDLRGRPRARAQALVFALALAARRSPQVARRARATARAERRALVAEGVEPGAAVVLQLALDGLWLGEAAGTLGLTAGDRRALRRALEGLAS